MRRILLAVFLVFPIFTTACGYHGEAVKKSIDAQAEQVDAQRAYELQLLEAVQKQLELNAKGITVRSPDGTEISVPTQDPTLAILAATAPFRQKQSISSPGPHPGVQALSEVTGLVKSVAPLAAQAVGSTFGAAQVLKAAAELGGDVVNSYNQGSSVGGGSLLDTSTSASVTDISDTYVEIQDHSTEIQDHSDSTNVSETYTEIQDHSDSTSVTDVQDHSNVETTTTTTTTTTTDTDREVITTETTETSEVSPDF